MTRLAILRPAILIAMKLAAELFYFEIIPASNTFHGQKALIYSSSVDFMVGQIVKIQLRNVSVLGFVVKKTAKPTFTTKNLDALASHYVLPTASLELFKWMQDYYPAPVGLIAQHFLPRTLLSESRSTPGLNDQISPRTITPELPKLTNEQTTALTSILNGPKKSFLLHGETGSGKTRIYIELVGTALAKGKSAIILTPEISLTPQLVTQLKDVFGDRVLICHSRITERERRLLWEKVLKDRNTPYVIVGARSALFIPVANLGLVVVDEFHESAYKQESSPHYHALRLAGKLSQSTGSLFVFGSATPTVSEYFFAKQKDISILRMKSKAIVDNGGSSIDIHVVDIAASEEKTSVPLLTRSLVKHIKISLAAEEQTILFLNKRGSARTVVCQSCGWNAHCKNCDLPLTYHQDAHQLRCHTCGYKMSSPGNCPTCSSPEIIYKSPGTKSLAAAISRMFPDAVVARFDKDNSKPERLESRHTEVQTGAIDILVGTQTLAKGHDLPKLGLVGIIQAETGLEFPDYTSEERSYQLLRQLFGRVGRGHRPGRVIVQTFHKDSMAIKAATEGSWEDFYARQLAHRSQFGFPPYYHLLKIELSRASSASAQDASQKLYSSLTENFNQIELLGPAPSFIEKKGNKWHWQIVVKAKKRSILTDIARFVPSTCTVDIDPVNLL